MTNKVLVWKYTNENLAAITLGLDLNSSDRVLAVGGSGDQALAILEYANSVKLVDNNPLQIDYALERIEKLRKGDFESFLETRLPSGFISGKLTQEIADKEIERRNKYFFTGRLENIASRLDRLDIECADIVETAIKENDFTKIYLSNVIGFKEKHLKQGINVLDFSSKNLPKEGLVYSAVHGQMQYTLLSLMLPKEVAGDEVKIAEYLINCSRLPKKLKLDRKLTKKAFEIEFEGGRWLPGVYRKTG